MANAVSGASQAGAAATQTGGYHASLWTGTAASWVDLHPAGATYSGAYGVSTGNQVGYAVMGGSFRASLWSGTAAWWVDLNPAGSAMAEAYGIAGPDQVGWALVGGVGRASLWSGTAASWVDLHPAGMEFSQLYAAFGPYQVGYVDVGGPSRVVAAGVWAGTAASWVDLHALLPTEFAYSEATCISSDGTNYYVGGYGYNTQTGRREALLWTQPVPVVIVTDSFLVIHGTPVSGGVIELAESDDQYLVLDPEFLTFRYQLEFTVDATAPSESPSGLEFSYESRALNFVGTVEQKIELFNYDSGQFETIDTRLATAHGYCGQRHYRR